MRKDPALVLDAVVLAAGLSRRAGAFKPAIEIAGRPLLRHAVDGLLPWCRRLVVVTGHERSRAEAIVAGLDGVVTVLNPRYREDMFHSVQAGAAAVGDDAAGFFILPVDCPFVEAAVVRALVAAFTAHGCDRAVVPEHEGRGGHPLLLPIAARAAILEAAPPANLRSVAAAFSPVRVPVQAASVRDDLDTPADLDRCATPDRDI